MIKGFSITQVLGASGVTLSPGDVWNDAGTTFTGIKFNVTDTASNASSRLLDLQVGGLSQFSVRKDGAVLAARGSSTVGGFRFLGQENVGIFVQATNIGIGSNVLAIRSTNGVDVGINSAQFRLQSALSFGWSSGDPTASNSDLELFRDAANTLAQRRGTNAQTKRIYGTYTDASNYRRVAIAMTTGGVASIAPEGAGTGASGNVLHISGLPTANPGPGILWNNGGTVEVGT